jgi:hypothetical protein
MRPTLGVPAVRPTLGAGFNSLALRPGVEGFAGWLTFGVMFEDFVNCPLLTLGIAVLGVVDLGVAVLGVVDLGAADLVECLTLGAVFILRSLFLAPTR